MWVFGYGSLMWDRWETRFAAQRMIRAGLAGYRRSFNKASLVNWGTRDLPGPTLGLEPSESEKCIGCAFQFSDAARSQILGYLQQREGKSFSLEELVVQIEGEPDVFAIVPVNDRLGPTYLGARRIEDLVSLAARASGKAAVVSSMSARYAGT
jgi:glutathione-specific gamma-glutamylcyclotransferase